MAFIALDVGNTRLKWAMYDAPHPRAQLLAHGAVFLENIDKLADDEWGKLPVPDRMLGCIVAGEAAAAKRWAAISRRPSKIKPSINTQLTDMLGAIFHPAPPVI